MPDFKTIPIYIYIIIGILIVFVLGAWMLHLLDFIRELRYLNKEIACTSGADRKHWLRQRRRLWLSLLPFIKY
jgi:hypothetical protein